MDGWSIAGALAACLGAVFAAFSVWAYFNPRPARQVVPGGIHIGPSTNQLTELQQINLGTEIRDILIDVSSSLHMMKQLVEQVDRLIAVQAEQKKILADILGEQASASVVPVVVHHSLFNAADDDN